MAEEQEQYVVLEGSAIALPEDENGIITYQLTDDVNQAGIYRLVNALPASSFTLGFDMSIEDHDGESLFVIELADDYKAFRIAHTISPSSVTIVIDMDWKTYDGEDKHYDIHTSTFEVALLPLVNGIWELSMINGFMSLSIDENLIIDNLDVEPYPISLDSGIVVVRAITTDTPIVQTIHDVFLEPVIVFDNHVYFSKSVLAEKYENLTWEDLGDNAKFTSVEVSENVIVDGSITAGRVIGVDYNDVSNKPIQVNADWNAISGAALILNKPTIPSGQVNADWNATSGAAQILNKPTIPSGQVNADWNAVSGAAQILNKPAASISSQWATSGTGDAGTGITYSAGSVGIGTTIPISHPSTPILDVYGSMNVNKTASGGPTRIYVASGCALAVAGPESLDCHAAFGGVYYPGYMVSITGGLKVSGAFVVDMTVGAVGTYALLGTTTKANRVQGTTLAGSSLRYASTYCDGYLGLRNSAPAGTWRLCGNTGYYLLGSTYTSNGTNDITMNASLWYRYV